MELTYLTKENIQKFIQSALNEDIGEGDHSSLAAIPEAAQSRARLLIKGEGILAGVALAQQILNTVDASLEIETYCKDGQAVKYGEVGFAVSGSARSILSAERLLLNCMQRMSGIATYTHSLKELIKHTDAKLLDTRKTTPNFRLPEKWAVAIGGGTNHRFALYDMIMLKDNHVDFAGGIAQAIRSTQAYLEKLGKPLKIEIETRNLEEVKQVLAIGGVDIIMLDNMSPELMREAVSLIGGKYKTEASGNINEQTISAVAESGVDAISVGALTHSVKSMDISLKAY
ncbi:nicotinate-nucleotide pyrophosphorylase (carboxylating) [Catalinimonas alkaloidigena]|uniref:carboxylating nicotinate-nucleotide diphosphorylase n=1 Tax=Catalinimonas alkaloidigena TaxID=1075417 RepID=UPI0024056595|nr:carboxylating nicotinate-nucleotide diphosphorylase [Catalinimonas alkaloidigena]MDF9799459.1 nicotinate-nucleotide pyrophosphorylase (carboxylating) [Catalinimonas alkaloidigena]